MLKQICKKYHFTTKSFIISRLQNLECCIFMILLLIRKVLIELYCQFSGHPCDPLTAHQGVMARRLNAPALFLYYIVVQSTLVCLIIMFVTVVMGLILTKHKLLKYHIKIQKEHQVSKKRTLLYRATAQSLRKCFHRFFNLFLQVIDFLHYFI